MNTIFIALITLALYFIFHQNKQLKKEILKKQITDSLLMGIMKANDFFVSELGFWIGNVNNPKEDDLNKIKGIFPDLILKEVYFYSFLVESFESYFIDEEWEILFANPRKSFDFFVDKPQIVNSKLHICDEPLRNLFLTVSILSLYKNEKTKNNALNILNTIPIAVKNNILSIISHPKFSEIIK